MAHPFSVSSSLLGMTSMLIVNSQKIKSIFVLLITKDFILDFKSKDSISIAGFEKKSKNAISMS